MASCPECEYDEISLDEFEEGDTISCPECGALLVMTGDDELDFADDLDEDEDEEEEEEEDDEGELDEDEEEGEDEDWEE